MRNSVEVLRSICFTKEDLENITNLGDAFTEEEIDFMVEFKKIYELGLNQLEKFINKLDEEGKDLNEYAIKYYVSQLQNGPLASYVATLSEDKNYFIETPNIMGINGNKQLTTQNTTVLEGFSKPQGCPVDIYNKLPDFLQNVITTSVDKTESMFQRSILSSTTIDNTLPIVDKAPQQRYNEEPEGTWVTKANGSYLVKDSLMYRTIEDMGQDVFDKVKEFLNEENFRLWADNKTFNPFSDDNDSKSVNTILKKNIQDGENEREVELDMLGATFDSVERRQSTLKIADPVKDREYALGTVEGQLGS